MAGVAHQRKAQTVPASVVIFWAVTSLVMFWFLLEGSSYMAGIGLVVQAVGIVALLGSGVPPNSRFSAGRFGIIVVFGFLLVFVAHWLASNHHKIIF